MENTNEEIPAPFTLTINPEKWLPEDHTKMNRAEYFRAISSALFWVIAGGLFIWRSRLNPHTWLLYLVGILCAILAIVTVSFADKRRKNPEQRIYEIIKEVAVTSHNKEGLLKIMLSRDIQESNFIISEAISSLGWLVILLFL